MRTQTPLVLAFFALVSIACGAPGSTSTPPPPAAGVESLAAFATETWALPDDAGFYAELSVANAGEAGSQSLSITKLDVAVRIEGRRARTSVTQVFQNNQGWVSEGRYAFTLPRGAAVTRLAMDVEGVLMEGELVERTKARTIYEGIVRRRRDPALLEWDGNDRFSTRVFPIPAHGTKTVVLEYEEVLPGHGQEKLYRYAMPRVSTVGAALGAFHFELDSDAEAMAVIGYPAAIDDTELGVGASVDIPAFVPSGPLTAVLTTKASTDAARVARWTRTDGSEEYFFGADMTFADVGERAAPSVPLVIAIDTSASVGDRLVAELGDAVRDPGLARATRPATVVTGDLEARVCPINQVDPCFPTTLAGGASDLAELVSRSLDTLDLTQPATLIVISDGSPSLGLQRDALIETVERRLEGSSVTVHTLGVGGMVKDDVLSAISRIGGGLHRRLPASIGAEGFVGTIHALEHAAVVRDLHVQTVSGEVSQTLGLPRAIAVGSGFSLAGRLLSDRAELVVTGQINGEIVRQRVTVARADASPSRLIPHYWAKERIEVLNRDGDEPGAIETSVEYGVMSRWTSFLVLESEQMYQQNEIERQRRDERGEDQRTGEAFGADPTEFEGYDRDWHGQESAGLSQDSDMDGIVDAVDRCPLEAEIPNGVDDEDGCPDSDQRVVVVNSRIEVREYIYFEPGKATIPARSYPLLEAIAQVMAEHPRLELIAVEGHTDDRERRKSKRYKLGLKRSEAVIEALVSLGVERSRLVANSYGEVRPIADPRMKDGRARNRRVEFLIVRADGEWYTGSTYTIGVLEGLNRVVEEDAILVDLYVEVSRQSDAEALLDVLEKRIETSGANPYLPYRQHHTRNHFLERAIAVATSQPGELSDLERAALIRSALAADRVDPELLESIRPPSLVADAASLLNEIHSHDPALAKTALETWTRPLLPMEAFRLAIATRAVAGDSLVERGLDLLEGDLGDADRVVVLAALSETANDHLRRPAIDTAVMRECEAASEIELLERCFQWLVEGQEAVSDLRTSLIVRGLADVRLRRADDFDSPDLVETEARWLIRQGDETEARRVLSEVVELAPSEGPRWRRYGESLAALEDWTEACAVWNRDPAGLWPPMGSPPPALMKHCH